MALTNVKALDRRHKTPDALVALGLHEDRHLLEMIGLQRDWMRAKFQLAMKPSQVFICEARRAASCGKARETPFVGLRFCLQGNCRSPGNPRSLTERWEAPRRFMFAYESLSAVRYRTEINQNIKCRFPL